ncbi:hypothetical protein AVEN_208756-1 [Araneus ventricosus]|uniref:Uncharacterized protein n=1 Tax=Araneus ventricosus TaxID=182803 RepID=A0A4Y2VCJ9_ARAVE|nr:hypothetical protein AVEN_229209-1 [Araneus ventricosus]GBO22258.1 hypothetical protein AVEN_47690-1 [Araneus ventricosus]GBO22261.1 hypothetical protein AVEN_202515-1 [Araneus ventricosus]GBO22262.1 hypothetical protein AVEN_208756-1 [Araneus ventricosus]
MTGITAPLRRRKDRIAGNVIFCPNPCALEVSATLLTCRLEVQTKMNLHLMTFIIKASRFGHLRNTPPEKEIVMLFKGVILKDIPISCESQLHVIRRRRDLLWTTNSPLM